MTKVLYIIRHGQTDLNLGGIVQGRGIDAPLNATGLRQADAFYGAYKDEGFDHIYTSNLQRTHQTVGKFVHDGIPLQPLEGLDEISWGIYEGKEQSPEIITGFERLVSAWRRGELDVAVEKGESPIQLIERQRLAMDYILAREDERKVLICMHGRAMRILLSWFTGGDASQMDDFPHTNTSLYKVLVEGARREIIDAYNIEHLSELR